MKNKKINSDFNKPMLEDVYMLREWMPFSDQEIAIFQHFFIDYFLENEDKLSKKDVYKLATLASDTQYQIRLLKARISGENVDIDSNNNYIKILMSFNGIIEFIRDKMILGFENTSIDNKYKLMTEHYSYFTASDTIKDSIKKDFDIYFSS
jgi:hypothetical protein